MMVLTLLRYSTRKYILYDHKSNLEGISLIVLATIFTGNSIDGWRY